MHRVALYLFLINYLTACTITQVVKPLNEGEERISLNLGGPLIGFDSATIAVPLTSAYYARGIDSNISVYGGLQLTNLAYGVGQIEAGFTSNVFRNSGIQPGLSAGLSANFVVDGWDWNTKLYPQLNANLYWEYGRKNLVYLGASGWLEFGINKAHGIRNQAHYLSSFHIGHTLNLNSWNIGVEGKILAPLRSNNDIVVDYKTPLENGALGIYLGISKTLK